MDNLRKCNMCPHKCLVDRENNKQGFCNAGSKIKIALADVFHYEEPCISGENGSGTIFFSNCNLRCVYCQNRKIAEGVYGKEITVDRLAAVFLELQGKGANNINLVTPSHYVLQIIEALQIAKGNGLSIPIVYNSSAYEKVETLKLLEGYVDVYLPDFKYMDEALSKKYRGSYEKALSNYVKDRLKDREDIEMERIFVTHTETPQDVVDSVIGTVKEYKNFEILEETVAGCTVSCHCGPNTLGVLFIRK